MQWFVSSYALGVIRSLQIVSFNFDGNGLFNVHNNDLQYAIKIHNFD